MLMRKPLYDLVLYALGLQNIDYRGFLDVDDTAKHATSQ